MSVSVGCAIIKAAIWTLVDLKISNKKPGSVHQRWSVPFLLLILSVFQNREIKKSLISSLSHATPISAQRSVFHISHNAYAYINPWLETKVEETKVPQLVHLSCRV